MVKPTNNRPIPHQGAPPLPAGQPPQQQQQPDAHVIAAAWQAYYAQNPTAAATVTQAAQPPHQPGPYQNYGYGAGVAMGGGGGGPAAAHSAPGGYNNQPQPPAGRQNYPPQQQHQPQAQAYQPPAPQVPAYSPQQYQQQQQGYNAPAYGAPGPAVGHQYGGGGGGGGGHHQNGGNQGAWGNQNQPPQNVGYGGPPPAGPIQPHYGGTGVGATPAYANVNQPPPNQGYNVPPAPAYGQPQHGNTQYPPAPPSANRSGFAGPPPGGAPRANMGPPRQNGPTDYPPAKRPRMDAPPHVPNNRGPPPIVRGFGGGGAQGPPPHGNAHAGPSSSNYQAGGGGNYLPPPQSDYGGSDMGRGLPRGGGGGGRGGDRGRGAPAMRGTPLRGGRGGGIVGVGHHQPDSPRGGRGGSVGGRGGSERGGRGGRGGFVGGPAIASVPAKYPPGPPSASGSRGVPTPNGKTREPRQSLRGGASARGGRVVPASSFKKDKIVISDKDKAAQEVARRKTLTDFRILGLEIKTLGWSWGEVGEDVEEKEEGASEDEAADVFEDAEAGEEDSDAEAPSKREEKKTAEAVPVPVEPEVAGLSKKQKKEKNKREREAAEAATTAAGATETVGELSVSAVNADLPVDLQAEMEEGSKKKNNKKKGAVAVVEGLVGEDVKPSVETEAPKEEVKRGEKRKAKMSSPDADDDARQTSKKRANLNSSTSNKDDAPAAPASPVKQTNRLRIYFESQVAPEPVASKALKRKADVSADEPRTAPTPPHDEDEDEEHENGVEESEDVDGDELVITGSAPEEVGGEFEGGDDGEVEVAPVNGENDELPTRLGAEADVEVAEGEEAELTVEPVADESQVGNEGPVGPEVAQEDFPVNDEMDVTVVQNGDHVADEQDEDGDVKMEEVEAEAETEDLDGEPVEAVDGAPADEVTVSPAQEDTSAPAAESATDGATGKATTEAADAAEAVKLAKQMKESAEATSAAYKKRAVERPLAGTQDSQPSVHGPYRRSPSLPPTDSETPAPSSSRISILYDNGTRRMCLDAAVVEKIRIFRAKGVIHVFVRLPADDMAGGVKVDDISQKTGQMEVSEKAATSEAPAVEQSTDGEGVPAGANDSEWGVARGLLLEVLDETKGIFSQVTRSNLQDLWTEAEGIVSKAQALPPMHRIASGDESTRLVKMTVYLDSKNRFSEPKWVKTGQLNEWVHSVFGSIDAKPATNPWQGKLEVVDPDAPSSINSILENWTIVSDFGVIKSRRRFVQTHFASVGNVVQILLQILRGEKKPVSKNHLSQLQGPLATVLDASARYSGEQTHATLAVLAMVNLAREYAEKAGEDSKILDKKIKDIVKSLPNQCLFPAVDKLFLDWLSQEGRKK